MSLGSLAAKALMYGLAAMVILAVTTAPLAFQRVPEGHVGVEKNWGAVTGDTLEPDLHYKLPIVEGIQNVEVREREYTMSNDQGEGEKDSPDAVSVKSINGTQHDVDVTVRYEIEKTGVADFVVDWNNEEQFESRFLRPEIRGVVYAEGGAMSQDEIFTRSGRDRFAHATRERLVEQSPPYIHIEAVIVRDVSIPGPLADRYNDLEGAKIDARTQKEQIEVERAKAEQKRVQAEAQADVIEIEGEALRNNPEVLKLRQIEAYDEGTVYVIPSTGTEVLVSPEQRAGSTSNSSSTTTGVPASP